MTSQVASEGSDAAADYRADVVLPVGTLPRALVPCGTVCTQPWKFPSLMWQAGLGWLPRPLVLFMQAKIVPDICRYSGDRCYDQTCEAL